MEKQIYNMIIKANQKFEVGDYKGVIIIANDLKSLGTDNALNIAACFFIDAGSALQDENEVQKGIELLEKFEKKFPNFPSLNSNLGNGYSALFGLEYYQKKSYYFKDTELDKAMENYRKALEVDKNPENFINLANCYDHHGRVLEAMENYDNALKMEPHHPMALGNKGMAFYNYGRLTGEKGTFFIESYHLVSKALNIGVQLQDEHSFKETLRIIEKIVPNKEDLTKHLDKKKYEIKAESKLEKDLTQFCLDNKLYLNICNYCQRCNNAIGDPIVIKNMMSSIDQFEEGLENSPVYQLLSYLNQIKQDYVTARFILFLSRYPGLDFSLVDKNVTLINN